MSNKMIEAEGLQYKNKSNARFALSSYPDQVADYGFAFGVFNVRLDRSYKEWQSHYHNILDKTSFISFTFNWRTPFSYVEKMRGYLYYADSCVVFDLCDHRYSKNVAFLYDYRLNECTVLVGRQQ